MSFCHKILEEIHPVLYRDIMNNVFTIFLTIQPFTRIICDRVIEMAIDKLSKSAGGLPRITENKYVSERWMRINHVMVALTHKSLEKEQFLFILISEGKGRMSMNKTSKRL